MFCCLHSYVSHQRVIYLSWCVEVMCTAAFTSAKVRFADLLLLFFHCTYFLLTKKKIKQATLSCFIENDVILSFLLPGTR